MSKVSYRLLLFSFNMTSVLMFNYTGHHFKISKTTLGLNCLKLPLSIFVGICIYSSPSLYNQLILSFEKKNYSLFSRNLMVFCNRFASFTALVICFVNIWKRDDILKLLNQANNLRKTNNEIFKKYFFKNLMKVSWAVYLFSLTILLIQLLCMKKQFIVIFPAFLFVYPYILVTNFLGFVKCFEIFLISLLKQFHEDLEQISSKCFEVQIYVEFSKKYREIEKVSKSFNEVFGAQLSLVTSCVAIATLLDVRCF